MKGNHGARGISASGAKGVLIELLTKVLNDNVVVVSKEKIVALLPVPTSRNNPSKNRTRCLRQGEAVHVEAVWIPFEFDETSTAAADKTFASCSVANKKETDNIFLQRSYFSNVRDRKYLSRTKRKNQIGRNGHRMKNHED